METDLFYKGVRPALNAGLSVSRVGSAAQIKAMKKVAGKLKLSLAQYRELEAFAQFGSDLDEATKQQLNRGARLTEILKQPQYSPLSQPKQVAIIYAVTNGYADQLPVDKMADFEEKLFNKLDTAGQAILDSITKEKILSENMEEKLKKLITDLVDTLDYKIEEEVKDK